MYFDEKFVIILVSFFPPVLVGDVSFSLITFKILFIFCFQQYDYVLPRFAFLCIILVEFTELLESMGMFFTKLKTQESIRS